MNTAHKIIIIGGGPAGLSTGLHLIQRNPALLDDILILEAKEYPRPKLCGGGITVHGEEQLHNLGIDAKVSQYVMNNLAFQLGDQVFSVPYRHAMRVINRAEFDAAIAKAAQLQGLALHTSERLLNLRPVTGGMQVETDRDTYFAKVVVAADGANSTARHKLAFRSEQSVARLLRVMTPVDHDDATFQSHTALFDFTCIQHGVQGYAWDFPCYYEGKPHINRGIFDSRILPREKQRHGNFKETFRDWLAERDINLDDVQLKGHPVRWFSPTAEFSRPHVLLTGDAAGVDPLFAEGISYAMEYGSIAAGAIIDALASDDFAFADYRARVLNHHMGTLLKRRTWMARTLYAYRLPPFWWIFWKMAGYAWPDMQQSIGAWMALLPPKASEQARLIEKLATSTESI